MMTARIKELKPLIVCFNGKGTYESYHGDKCDWGLQPEPIPGTSTVSKTGYHSVNWCYSNIEILNPAILITNTA